MAEEWEYEDTYEDPPEDQGDDSYEETYDQGDDGAGYDPSQYETYPQDASEGYDASQYQALPDVDRGDDSGSWYDLFTQDYAAPAPEPQTYEPGGYDRGPGTGTWYDAFEREYAPQQPRQQAPRQARPYTPAAPVDVDTWADGTPMDEKAAKQARVYRVGLEQGLDEEGARVLIAVTETEAGLFGAIGDNGQSRGPFQFYEQGQMPAFRQWLAANGVQGDPNQLVHDPELATSFAASNYLGQAIKRGQAQGLHGADLATYAQRTGQVSVSPERTGQNYQRLFAQGDPYGDALKYAQPTEAARTRANERIPPGHYDGDGHDHGVSTPYTQQQVDSSGSVWTIAFDYDQPYDRPFNAAIPNHRGVDLQLTGAPNGGENTPYTAMRDGRVVQITNDPHGGIGIIVDTGNPAARYDRYFHNNAVSVRQGDTVRAGETTLGLIGQTGTQGFPHLHYEVSQGINGDPAGQTIDPRPFLGPPPGRAPAAARAAPGQRAPLPAAPVAAAQPTITELQTPYTSGRRSTTDGIVIHATRGQGETPQAEYDWTIGWFGQNPYQVSANAVIGPDGRIAMPRDWDLITHHAGENNGTKFGIELAQSAADAERNVPYTDAQYQSLGWLLGQLGRRYNIPLDRSHVVGHEELDQGRRQGKTDPGPNFDWARALDQGQGGYRAQRTVTPMVATPSGVRRPVTTGRGEGVVAPAETNTYTVGGRPASREQFEEAVAQQRESRAAFEASLPTDTRRAFGEWSAAREARDEPVTLPEFRAHLGRLGAPDPWAPRAQPPQPAATAAARAPAAAAEQVYTYKGERITGAQYESLRAQAAAGDRIAAAHNERAAAANAELEALRRYEARARDAAADPEAASTLGVRPPTPNLDYLQSQDIALNESAGPREQTAVQKADLASWTEDRASPAYEGPVPATNQVYQQALQNSIRAQQQAAERAERDAALLEQSQRGWVDDAREAFPGVARGVEWAGEKVGQAASAVGGAVDTVGSAVTPYVPAGTPSYGPSGAYSVPPGEVDPDWKQRGINAGMSEEQATAYATTPAVREVSPDREVVIPARPERFDQDHYDGMIRAGIPEEEARRIATIPASPERRARVRYGAPEATIDPSLTQGQIQTNAWDRARTGVHTAMIGAAMGVADAVGRSDVTDRLAIERQRIEDEAIARGAYVRASSGVFDPHTAINPVGLEEALIENAPSTVANLAGLAFGGLGVLARGAGLARTAAGLATAGRAAGYGGLALGVVQQATETRRELDAEVAAGRVTPGQANLAAGFTGGLEWLTEEIFPGLDRDVRRGIGRSVTRNVVGGLKRVGIESATEGAEEIISQVGQEAVSQALAEHRPSLSEALANIAQAGLVGAVSGGGLTTTGAAVTSATEAVVNGLEGRREARNARELDAAFGSPAEILAREGLQIKVASPDFTSYAVRHVDPSDPTRQRGFTLHIGEDDADGNPTVTVGPRYIGPALNTVDIPSDPGTAARASRGATAAMRYLNGENVLSDAVANAAITSLTDRVAAAQRGAPVAAAARPGREGSLLRAAGAGDFRPPEGWNDLGAIPGTDIVLRAANHLPTQLVEQVRRAEFTRTFGAAIAGMVDRLDRRSQDLGITPRTTRRRNVSQAVWDGGMRAQNDNIFEGRFIDPATGRPTRDPSTGVGTLGGMTYDTGAILGNALTKVDADNRTRARLRQPPLDFWDPETGAVYLAAAAGEAAAHEPSHDVDAGHGDRFEQTFGAYTEAVLAEQQALVPIMRAMMDNGAVAHALGLQAQVLQQGARSPTWKEAGDEYARRLAAARARGLGGPAVGAAAAVRGPGGTGGRGAQRADGGPVPAAGGGVRAVPDGGAGVRAGAPALEPAALVPELGPPGEAPSALVPTEVARAIPTEVRLPDDPGFREAVAATAGARITADGLEVDYERNQAAAQAGEPSVRSSVYGMARPLARNPYRGRGSQAGFGGPQRIEGRTLFKRPLAVSGGTGGQVAQRAYDRLVGRGAYEALRHDVISSLPYFWNRGTPDQLRRATEQILARHGGDPSVAGDLVRYHNTGNRLIYGITENIAAAEARRHGYDSIVGVSRGRLGELIDLRARTYPDEEGNVELHPQFEPPVTRRGAAGGPPERYEQRGLFDADEVRPSGMAAREAALSRPIPTRSQYPPELMERLLGAGLEYQPGRGLVMDAAAPRAGAVEVDRRPDGGIAFVEMAPGEGTGEVVLANPFIHEGGSMAADRAAALAALLGEGPETASALVASIQDAIALDGPTTDNVRSVMAGLGLGDPDQAALLVTAARGDTGAGPNGLAARIVSQMLAHEGRIHGHDGLVAPAPDGGTAVAAFRRPQDAAETGYAARDGQLVYEGAAETPPGYAVEDGRLVHGGGAGGYAIEDGRPVYTGPSAMATMYHGTTGGFHVPDAARFDPDGLFGPAYYLTTDPRIAGSYATTRGDDGRRIADDLERAERSLARWWEIASGDGTEAEVARAPRRVAEFERLVEALQGELARVGERGGPNLRRVDVPDELDLLDADAPVSVEEANRVFDELDRAGFPDSADEMRALMEMRLRPSLGAELPPVYDSGEDLYQDIAFRLSEDYQTVVDTDLTEDKAGANRILAALGYDGIRYQGGRRIPMQDKAGRPIEHEAVAIFEPSIPKLTNLLNRTPEAGPSALEAEPPPQYVEPPAIVSSDTRTPPPFNADLIVPRQALFPRLRSASAAESAAPPPFAGPPLVSPEDAIDRGWVGIPDPRSPIRDRVDLHNRLALTPFISQRELIALLGDRPEDLQQVIDFMLAQRAKVTEGRLVPSDVAKAYLMTVSSQGQGAVNAEIIRAKTGLEIPDHFLTPNAQGVRQIRPEDAAAAWIASPTGQRALYRLDQGVFDEAAWADAAAVRSAFSDDRLNRNNVLGTRPNRPGKISMKDVPRLTEHLNTLGDNPRQMAESVARLNGIGPRKNGFIQHLLGFGETPTMDSRVVNTWITGRGDTRGMDTQSAQIARAMNQHLHADMTGLLTLARIISGYNQLRRSGFAPDIPRAVYNAVMHNWLWSKVKGVSRTYGPMYEAQAAPVTEPEGHVPDTAYWRDDFEVRNREMESWLRDPYEEQDRELGPAELEEDDLGPSAMAARAPRRAAPVWQPAPPIEDDELALFRLAAYRSDHDQPLPEGAPVIMKPITIKVPNAPAVLVPGTKMKRRPTMQVPIPHFVTRSGAEIPIPPSDRGLMGSPTNAAYTEAIVLFGGFRGFPSGRWTDSNGIPRKYDSPGEIVTMAQFDGQQQRGEIRGWWTKKGAYHPDLMSIPFFSTNRDKGGEKTYEPDFLVQTPDGKFTVVEQKAAPVLAYAEEYGVQGGRITGKMGWDVAKKSIAVIPILADADVGYRLNLGSDTVENMPDAPSPVPPHTMVRSFVGIPGVDWRDLAELERRKPLPEAASRGNAIAARINQVAREARAMAAELKAQGLGQDERIERLTAFVRKELLPTSEMRDPKAQEHGETRLMETQVQAGLPEGADVPGGPLSLGELRGVYPEAAELIDDATGRNAELVSLSVGEQFEQDGTVRRHLEIAMSGDPQAAQRLAAGLGVQLAGQAEVDYWHYDTEGRTQARALTIPHADGVTRANVERIVEMLNGAPKPGQPRLVSQYNSEGGIATVHLLGQDREGAQIAASDVAAWAKDIADRLGAFGVAAEIGDPARAVVSNFGAEGGYDEALRRREQLLGIRPLAVLREPPAGRTQPGELRLGGTPPGGGGVSAAEAAADGESDRGDLEEEADELGPSAMAALPPGMGIPAERRRMMAEAAASDHAEHGGSTINLRRGNLAGTANYAVGIYPERAVDLDEAPSPEWLEQYVAEHEDLLMDPRNSLGTWHDADDSGRHYIEVSVSMADRAEAELLGRRYNQKAIYGLADFEEINTGGDGTAIPNLPPETERLAHLETTHGRGPAEEADLPRHYRRGVGEPADQGRAGPPDAYPGGGAAEGADGRAGDALQAEDPPRAEGQARQEGLGPDPSAASAEPPGPWTPVSGLPGDLHQRALRGSPRLRAQAAESTASLQEALVEALADAPIQSLDPDELRALDGHARYYTDAIVGLASEDPDRLERAGLDYGSAQDERERAIGHLERTGRLDALYEAEAAWASLSPRDDLSSQGPPSAMAGQVPVRLAEPFYSRLFQVAAGLPETIEGNPGRLVRDKPRPERIVRRAAQNPTREPPPPGRGFILAPDGSWIEPAREASERMVEQTTPADEVLRRITEAGAKPDEIAWAGLETWLRDRGPGPVARADLLDHLDQRRIVVEEVLLGGRDLGQIHVFEDGVEQIEQEPQVMEEGYEDDEGNWVEPTYYDDSESEPEYRYTFRASPEEAPLGEDLVYEVTGNDDGGYWVTDEDGVAVVDDPVRDLDAAEHAIADHAEERLREPLPEGVAGPVQYEWEPGDPTAPLVEPGGQEYRELLLTLPVSGRDRVAAADRAWEAADDAYRAFTTRHTYEERVDDHELRRRAIDLLEAANEARDRATEERAAAERQRYTDSHFTQPDSYAAIENVALHVRFTTRIGPDGERILFIEELQSDWQQQGREKGFLPPRGLPKGYRVEYRPPSGIDPSVAHAVGGRFDREAGRYVDQDVLEPGTPEHAARMKSWSKYYAMTPDAAERDDAGFNTEAEATAFLERKVKTDRPPPEMPFMRTESWATLGFRRMVRYAAEHGYDQLAWTTGATQNARYGPRRIKNPQALPKFYDGVLGTVATDLGKPWGVSPRKTRISTNEIGTFARVEQQPDGWRYTTPYGDSIGGYPTEEAARAAADAQDDRTGVTQEVHVLDIPAQMVRSALEEGQPLFMTALPPESTEGAEASWDGMDPESGLVPELVVAGDLDSAAQEIDNPDDPPRTDGPEQVALVLANPPGARARARRRRGRAAVPSLGPVLGPTEPGYSLDDIFGEGGLADELEAAEAPAEPASAGGATGGPPGPPAPPVGPTGVPDLGPPDENAPNLDQFPEWAQALLEMGDLIRPGEPVTDPRVERADALAMIRRGQQGRDLAPRELEIKVQAAVLAARASRRSAELARGTQEEWNDVLRTVLNGPNGDTLSQREVEILAGAIVRQYKTFQRAATRAQGEQASAWAVAQMMDESRRYAAIRGLAIRDRAQWASLAEVWRSAPVTQGASGTLEQFLAEREAAEAAGDTGAVARLKQEGIERAEAMVQGQAAPRGARGRGQRRRQAGDAEGRLVGYGALMAENVAKYGQSPSDAAYLSTSPDLSIHPWEVASSIRYNNMLLGPRGILVDYTSNTGMLFGKMFADPVLLVVGEGIANPKAVGAISKAEYAALARFLPLAMRRMWHVLRHGISEAEAATAGVPHTISGRLGRRIEIARDEGAAWYGPRMAKLQLGRFGVIAFAELAGRLKGMADVGIRELSWGMEQTRQAALLAYRQGDHPVDSEEWHRRVADILAGKNLDSDPQKNRVLYEQMTRNSDREAERTTFQGEMGTVGRAMEKIQRNPLGQWFLPFLRTLYHIRGWAIDFSPLGAAVTLGDVARGGIHRGLTKVDPALAGTANRATLGMIGGPYQQAWRGAEVGKGVADLDRRALANAIGTAGFFYLLGAAMEGLLSGSGPPDEPIAWLDDERPKPEATSLRATMEAGGWRRSSVYLGGYWFNYQNWGPLAYLMGAAATIGETYKYGLAADRKRAPSGWEGVPVIGRMAAGGRGLADVVGGVMNDADTFKTARRRAVATTMDMSYVSGLYGLTEMLEHGYKWAVPEGPETPGEKTKRENTELAAIKSQFSWMVLSSLVPGSQLLNTIAQGQDPTSRATEFGGIKESLAYRLPSGVPGLGALTDDPWGSTTGTREGLAVRRDVLGRPVENEYAGPYAWLPFRATAEAMDNATLRALVDAGVGAPTPPSELYFKPEGSGRGLLIRVPQSIRQQVGESIGRAADARVKQELAAVPEAQRRADPAAWTKRLQDAMKETYFAGSDAARDDPAIKAQLAQLASDSSRTRWAETKKDREAVLGTAPPADGAAPTTTGTPRPGATAQPTAARERDLDAARNAARERAGLPPESAPAAPAPAVATPSPAATPPSVIRTPTPRAGGTPAPAATPAPLSPSQLDEARQRARERAGLPR